MGLDTMTSLLQYQLENEKQRHAQLLKTGRNDAVAIIVLERVKKEIQQLEKRVRHEESTRKEIATCASPCGFTRRIREIMYRYWVKCYGNHHAIPTIPAIETL